MQEVKTSLIALEETNKFLFDQLANKTEQCDELRNQNAGLRVKVKEAGSGYCKAEDCIKDAFRPRT
jgi:DNA-binding protein H-NS